MSDVTKKFDKAGEGVIAFNEGVKAFIENIQDTDRSFGADDNELIAAFKPLEIQMKSLPFYQIAPAVKLMVGEFPEALAKHVAHLATQQVNANADNISEQIANEIALAGVREEVPFMECDLPPSAELYKTVQERFELLSVRQSTDVLQSLAKEHRNMPARGAELISQQLHVTIQKFASEPHHGADIADRLSYLAHSDLMDKEFGSDTYTNAINRIFDRVSPPVRSGLLDAKIYCIVEDAKAGEEVTDPILARFGKVREDFVNPDQSPKSAAAFLNIGDRAADEAPSSHP